MPKFETVLAGLLWVAVLLVPVAALEPLMACVQLATGALGTAACDDGSAHLVMGCASILL